MAVVIITVREDATQIEPRDRPLKEQLYLVVSSKDDLVLVYSAVHTGNRNTALRHSTA